MGKFIKYVCHQYMYDPTIAQTLRDQFYVYCDEQCHTRTCIIDCGVYTKNRSFRLYLSSKNKICIVGEHTTVPSALIVDNCNQQICKQQNVKQMFFNSLICHVTTTTIKQTTHHYMQVWCFRHVHVADVQLVL